MQLAPAGGIVLVSSLQPEHVQSLRTRAMGLEWLRSGQKQESGGTKGEVHCPEHDMRLAKEW